MTPEDALHTDAAIHTRLHGEVPHDLLPPFGDIDARATRLRRRAGIKVIGSLAAVATLAIVLVTSLPSGAAKQSINVVAPNGRRGHHGTSTSTTKHAPAPPVTTPDGHVIVTPGSGSRPTGPTTAPGQETPTTIRGNAPQTTVPARQPNGPTPSTAPLVVTTPPTTAPAPYPPPRDGDVDMFVIYDGSQLIAQTPFDVQGKHVEIIFVDRRNPVAHSYLMGGGNAAPGGIMVRNWDGNLQGQLDSSPLVAGILQLHVYDNACECTVATATVAITNSTN
jgi:hypothetical protein